MSCSGGSVIFSGPSPCLDTNRPDYITNFSELFEKLKLVTSFSFGIPWATKSL